MFSKKRKVFARILSAILICSVGSMGFPGMLFASAESAQTAITNNTSSLTSNYVSSENEISSDETTTAPASADTTDQTSTGTTTTDQTTTNSTSTDAASADTATDTTSSDTTSTDTTFTGTTSADQTTADDPSKTVKPADQEKTILKELVNKRGANIKRFLMSDMSEEAVIYPSPVHFQDKGQWKEIDSTLNDSENNTVSNKANDFKINIAKNPTADKLVSIKKDNYEVSWKMENAQETTAAVTNDDNKEYASLTSEEQKKYIKNINSNVSFSNIFPDVDLNYGINSNNIKESIILKKATDINSFSFNLSTKNVTPELTKANTIIFYNNENKTPVFSLSAPVMYDAKGSTSDEISLKLNKEDNTLTLTPNNDWLKDSERAYPVTIDPSLTVDYTQFTDATVKQNSPNTTYNGASMDYLDVGNGTGTDGIEMSYLKFVLPELTSGDMVTSAKLKLYKFSTYTTSQINLYRVTNNWQVSSPSPITYNNQPNHNSAPEDFVKLTSGGGIPSFNWDITSLTKDWYVNGNNYGVLLKSTTDSTPGALALFGSTGCASTTKRPSVTIDYINCSGLQNYWSYHSQKVGRAGTIYTNDYNGNVTLVHDDVTMSGNRLPVVLKHVYNTNDKDSDLGYGKGWR